MCDHEEFNNFCIHCLDVDAYCAYAEKEGLADCYRMTWEEKKAYFNNDEADDQDENRDWEGEETDRQIADMR